jgi:MazG family protein
MADPLENLPTCGDARADALRRLIAIVDRLRAPDGCPWDREQTVESLAPNLIEEGYELLEAIERGDDKGAVEEAGDLLMVVALICRVAEERQRFDLARAGQAVCDKLVRRHPHVFGGPAVESAAHAIANWERMKAAERAEERADASALAGVPLALPALQRAHRVGAKAIAAGFRWTSAEGALEKLGEEIGELHEAVRALGATPPERASGELRARLEAELGDVLLAAASLGTYLGIEPERAARESLRRFESRFRAMEAELGGSVRGEPLERLLAAWRRAKQRPPSP